MTDSVNSTASAVESLIGDVLFKPAEEAALSALFLDVPILALFPFQPIIRAIAAYLYDKSDDYFKTRADIATIRLLNADHQRAYEDASLKLKVIAVESGVDSPEFQKAREDALTALSAFTRVNR